MAHILLVGKAFSGIKSYLLEHGHTYTLLQDVRATKFPTRRFKHRVVTDFSDESSMLAAVDRINAKQHIEATFVTYENYVLPNTIVAQHLGLPSMEREAAEACTDKEYMRQLFAKAPTKISPGFAVVDSEESLMKFADSHDFPLILKPANLAKSLLVTKNSDLGELIANYRKAVELLGTVYSKYAPGRTPKLLVEEYLDGPVHSVDVFVDAKGEPHVLENVVDYQTGYDIGYEDNFHYSRLLPSALDPKKIQEIRDVVAAGCRALGMKSSPAHVEIIYTRDGARIVEIGARNGGYRDRMHMLANGIDITANALALALDRPLDITPKRNDSVGVYELFPREKGSFVGLAHEAELRSLPSLHYLGIKAKPGQVVGKSGDGYKACAVAVFHNSDAEQFARDIGLLNSNVSVITER